MTHLISLLPKPVAFARSGGRQYDDPPGAEFVILPPSGEVATVHGGNAFALIPTAEHVPVCAVLVDTVEAQGEPRIQGLPTEPGHYLVSAQVADACMSQANDLRAAGIRLYTPEFLVRPGSPDHPGRDVLNAPFSPRLIRRV